MLLRTLSFKILNALLDVCFVADIALMFCTSFVDKKGREQFDCEKIAVAYSSTPRFYVDLLSLLGSGIFSYISKVFNYFGLFKLMRVFRLS